MEVPCLIDVSLPSLVTSRGRYPRNRSERLKNYCHFLLREALSCAIITSGRTPQGFRSTRSHKVRNNLHNAAFRPRQTAPSLLPHWSLSPPGTGHQPERTQARDLFFQDGRPLSRCRAYRTSNERREEDRTREGTYTHGQSARGSQGGQILSFRNKIIFRVRGPDLDECSRSDASLSCCCWMHSRTDWQTCKSPPQGDLVQSLPIPGTKGSVVRAVLWDQSLAGSGTRPLRQNRPSQRSGIV